MNNEQQPNISPDFGYIINQQSPQDKKPGVDKRIVFIIVAVVLLAIVFLLSLFVKPSNSKKKNSLTGPAAQQVISLNDALKAKDYEKAADIIGTNLNDSQHKLLVADLEKGAAVDINTCQITHVESQGSVSYVDNSCKSKNQSFTVVTTYTVVNSNGNYIITDSKSKLGQTS